MSVCDEPPVDRDFASFEYPTCLPTVAGSYDHPVSSERAGAAVAWVTFGASTTGSRPYSNLVDLVVGVPEASGTVTGEVRFVNVDRGTGAPSSSAADVLAPPATGFDGDRVGAALRAADVAAITTFSGDTWGSGQELIAGAPGGSGDKGAISWFYPAFVGTSPDDFDIRDQYQWQFGGSYTPPGLVDGSGFGTSIAVPPQGSAGSQVPWIVVGAPGANKVFVVEVDPSWAAGSPPTCTPLASVLLTLPGATNTGFGHAVHVDDFNGDGDLDLAVSAPFSAGKGTVYVYSGNSAYPATSTEPFLTSPTATLQTSGLTYGSAMSDDFGYALDSGWLRRADKGRILAVGPPGFDTSKTDLGAVCWVRFDQSNTNAVHLGTVCAANPFQPTVHNQRFGHAIAVANWSPYDSFADRGSELAGVEEIAIGVPGGAPQAEGSDPYQQSGSTTPGVVAVFKSDFDGPIIQASSSTDEHFLAQWAGDVDGAELGYALAVGRLGTFEDLAMGSPEWGSSSATGHGRATVTASTDVHGFDDPRAGRYEQELDSSTTADWRVFVTEDGLVGLVNTEALSFTLVDEEEVVCVHDGEDADLDIEAEGFVIPAIDIEVDGSTECAVVFESGPDLPFLVSHSQAEQTFTLDFSGFSFDDCELSDPIVELDKQEGIRCN